MRNQPIDALVDLEYRKQVQGLKDVTAALKGDPSSPVIFSTDAESVLNRKMQIDTSHLDVIRIRLSHERSRLETSRSDSERKLRAIMVAGIEREMVSEIEFLGLPPDQQTSDIDDDALLAELATESHSG